MGEKAYVGAGGTLTTDFFSTENYFNDSEILYQLAIEKLTKEVELPKEVDPEKIDAVLKEGVLRVTLIKRGETKIDVTTG